MSIGHCNDLNDVVGKSLHVGDLMVGDSSAATERGSVLNMGAASPDDPTRMQWMRLSETSGSFDFWSSPDEDAYTEEDGSPI